METVLCEVGGMIFNLSRKYVLMTGRLAIVVGKNGGVSIF